MSRIRQPFLEHLEDRTLLSAFGVPWPDPQHLTLSFVPDGTQVGSDRSDLFRLLDARYPRAVWQAEVLRAFQTWAVNANINIGLVPDSGLPIGTSGIPEGDPRFGDIRIAAIPMDPSGVAVASPFDLLAGTWSGDVKLNDTQTFGIGGSGYDLFSVMLHEAGHTFGLDDGIDPASPMFSSYLGVRAGLSAGDVTILQSLYGVRQADSFDAAAPNESLATASRIPLDTLAPRSQIHAADGDLTTLQDVDYYQFNLAGQTAGVTIRLRVAGLSLLAGRLTVYDGSGQVVSMVSANGVAGTDLSLELAQTRPSNTYYVRVDRSTENVFGIGSYRLEVDPSLSPPNNQGIPRDIHPATSGNNTLSHATSLQPQVFRTDGRFNYSYMATLGGASDVDFYRFKSPHVDPGTPNVMTVMVWGLQPGSFQPSLTLFDPQGNVVPAEILVYEDGSAVIQLRQARPNQTYILAVGPAHPGVSFTGATYFLGIDFGTQAATLQTFVDNQLLPAANTTVSSPLHIGQSELFHFIFSTTAADPAANEVVQMNIRDASGQAIGFVTLAAGETGTATVFLAPGEYFFEVSGQPTQEGQFSAVTYSIRGLGLSNPVGPEPLNVTFQPLPPRGPGGSTGKQAPAGIDFSQGASFLAFLTLQTPALASNSVASVGVSGSPFSVQRATAPDAGSPAPSLVYASEAGAGHWGESAWVGGASVSYLSPIVSNGTIESIDIPVGTPTQPVTKGNGGKADSSSSPTPGNSEAKSATSAGTAGDTAPAAEGAHTYSLGQIDPIPPPETEISFDVKRTVALLSAFAATAFAGLLVLVQRCRPGRAHDRK